MTNLSGVVRLLKKEQVRLAKELARIGAALAGFGKASGKGTGRRQLSAVAWARIVAAQRARWAKVRKTAKVVPIRGKRTLSAAARKKIAAAQRVRWAKVKAGTNRLNLSAAPSIGNQGELRDGVFWGSRWTFLIGHQRCQRRML